MPLCRKQSRRSRDAPIWSRPQHCVGRCKELVPVYLFALLAQGLGEGQDDGSDGDQGGSADLQRGQLLAQEEPRTQDYEDYA